MFLRSISFDHTVLLDFLISTETCFLEYCVRYLKLLLQDWTGFCTSCRRDEDRHGKLGGTTNVIRPQTSETPESSQMCARPSTGNDVRSGPVPRLVDYGSSDESGEESASDRHTNRDFRNTEDGDASEDQSQNVSDYPFANVLVCLQELKMAVSKLHNRGLFPYNPASLLKLLNNIELNKKKKKKKKKKKNGVC